MRNAIVPWAEYPTEQMRMSVVTRMFRCVLASRVLCVAALLAAMLAGAAAVSTQTPSEEARTLLSSYREDVTRIDRACDLLEIGHALRS